MIRWGQPIGLRANRIILELIEYYIFVFLPSQFLSNISRVLDVRVNFKPDFKMQT
jgi:hypothetical protein